MHGSTGKYLELAPGQAHLGIPQMARPGLRVELEHAIREARSRKTEVSRQNVRLEYDGGVHHVNLMVKPVRDPRVDRDLLVVLFQDTMPYEQPLGGKSKRAPRGEERSRIESLERELQMTRESHQTTIEELQTANEELQSSNEEMQSTSEEFQSSNEELETSREELQSVNEELLTLNAELESRLDDLTAVGEDLHNLLVSTDIATIFVDASLSIKRFTPRATDIFNLIPTDIGRPLEHITTSLDYPDMTRALTNVYDTLISKEAELRSTNGRWFRMCIRPYRTADNTVSGLVLTFADITEQKEASVAALSQLNRDLKRALAFSDRVVQTAREPMLVLDRNLQVLVANPRFYAAFEVDEAETVGRTIFDLGDGQWDIPQLRRALEDVLPHDSVLDGLRVTHDFPSIGYREMLLNAAMIHDERGGTERILLSMQDVTNQSL